MLYIWPFMTLLSFPLLVPYAINMLLETMAFVKLIINSPASAFTRSNVIYIFYLSTIEVVLLVIVHFNTIIHKYTLADNRHYVYYAFKYTVRRNAYMRYLMTPGYIACFLLCFQCLAGSPLPAWDALIGRVSAKMFCILEKDDCTVSKNGTVSSKPEKLERKIQTAGLGLGPSTSFFLIWILTSTLSLVTAPLVEPRYYLIPWVIWRLHVASLSTPTRIAKNLAATTTEPKSRMSDASTKSNCRVTTMHTFVAGYDYRLWFETVWYCAFNAWTMYMLLFRPFVWEGHPHELMRFMW